MPPRRNRLNFADSDFLKTARARFKFADDTDDAQRTRERDDLAFYAGDQWPADVRLARQGQQPTAGMPAVPSRPTLVINTVREPIRQIANEAQGADLGIEITPAEDFGDLSVVPDEQEITLREGLVRRIQRESQARDARMWAFDRAVKAGRGFYQVLTRYLPGKTWDQEVYVHRIYNQASVLLDPSHEEPDGSDAKWAFVCVDMLWEDYKAQFPYAADGSENRVAGSLTDSEWQVLGDEYPKWFQNADDSGAKDQKVRAVRVVDYWYTEQVSRELAILSDGTVVWKDELTKIPAKKAKRGTPATPAGYVLPEGVTIIDTRTCVEQQIKWAKIDGAQILEETDWPGPDMPIVKVLGEELQPYDGERRAEGMIRPARDPQMGLNYMVSKQVEMVGLTPIPPLMTDPDAIEGYESWYAVANTRTLPYLPYRTYDDQGRQLKEPHRPGVDPNLLPVSQSIAMFREGIQATTAVPASRLGDIDPVTRSGKAIRELTQNSQQSTSNFMQNLIRSLRYEGQIENNLLYPIYGARPGRLVRIMTGMGESQTIMVHDAPKESQLVQQAQAVAKLTPDAKFNINIKVARDFDTRRDQEQQTLGQLIAAEPQLMTWFGDLWFKNQDGPGHQAMAERAKVMLAPPIQKLLAATAQGQNFDPEKAALQAQLAQAQQQLQAAGMAIQTKQVEQQGKLQITQVQEAADLEKHRQDNETKLAVAELGAKVDRLALFLEERARLGSQQHDAAMAGAQMGHDAQQTQQQQGHEMNMAHQGVAASLVTPTPPSANGEGAPQA